MFPEFSPVPREALVARSIRRRYRSLSKAFTQPGFTGRCGDFPDRHVTAVAFPALNDNILYRPVNSQKGRGRQRPLSFSGGTFSHVPVLPFLWKPNVCHSYGLEL